MKKHGIAWPEKAFAGYVALMLALLVGVIASRSVVCLVAFEALSLPFGWLLNGAAWYSSLPQAAEYAVSFFVCLVNGAFFYFLAKLIARRPNESRPEQKA